MRISDWSSDVCSSDLGLLERSGGPFLFGAFTAADAMYAPVASRIQTYELPCSDTVAGYVATIQALPAFQEWLAKAVLERWVVEDDEIDMIQMRAKSAAEEQCVAGVLQHARMQADVFVLFGPLCLIFR